MQGGTTRWKRTSLLRCYNMAMARHKVRYDRGPISGPSADFKAYRAWLNERRDVLVALRDKELKLVMQQEEKKANERKRDQRGGASRRGC